MRLLSLKEQKAVMAGAAWIIGSLILISFFDIVKISLDSYQISQNKAQQKQSSIGERHEQKEELLLTQNHDILYV
ncbi:hypothetical protein [Spiroplasma endosymbiont of Stenodema calcarata]|uniref:hypothetical protein n=1 Tax=Spiroplasma endosymbiont of Stenodema calcarata TaxID=3139328 RepID=UPI003CCB00FA